MTLTELRTALQNALVYLDNSIIEPTGPQLTDQINHAIREVGRRLYLYDARITLTLSSPIASTNSAQFDLRDTANTVSRKVLEPHVVWIGGYPLKDYEDKPGLLSLSQLNTMRPKWPTESSSTTNRAVYLGHGVLLLSPPPSSAGSNNFISGTYLPADMTHGSDDGNEPDIPEELHEYLAWFAAADAAEPASTTPEQLSIINRYLGRANALIEEIAQANRNAVEGPWTDGGDAYPRYILA